MLQSLDCDLNSVTLNLRELELSEVWNRWFRPANYVWLSSSKLEKLRSVSDILFPTKLKCES